MRYIIGFILSIILIIFAFVLIFRGNDEEPSTTPEASRQLVEYANTAVAMEYTTDYAVSADQTHHPDRHHPLPVTPRP